MQVFSIDIGTRKVAGILGELIFNKIIIKDAVLKEHKKRAMLDGQIHNIEYVTEIVKEVVEEIEKKNNIKIEKATTALAGRNLITEKVDIKKEKKGEILKEDIVQMEMESVKKAYEIILNKNNKEYYCVGFSPVLFKIDGEEIKNPLQQFCRDTLEIQSIVTFLPKIVFNSIVSVFKNCGISIDSITLEPIAALQVTIPEDMRLLNLALVDIGAGTSDIAITDKGKIIAYGMIPKAGDEITEEICKSFIIDFNEAEKLKRQIETEKEVEVKNIFGEYIKINYEEFIKAIIDKTEEIATDIADKILDLNFKQPQAVVLVGGGSSLKIIKEKIATKLGISVTRVGNRLPKDIVNIENIPEILQGPEGITPIGILETAIYKRGLGFIEISINGEKEYILNLEQDIKLIDVLLAKGYELKKLYGKPGNALTYNLNGELKILRGGRAEHAKIYINGIQKNLDDYVKSGDKIFITEAIDGKDAKALIKDILPQDLFLTVELNGNVLNISPRVFCNGKEISVDEPLKDRADITYYAVNTLTEILAQHGINPDNTNERDIIITLNGEPVILKQRNYQLKVNGREVSGDYKVKNFDKISFREIPSYYRIKDILKSPQKDKIKVKINGKSYDIEKENYEIYMNGKRVSEDEFLINGANIEIKSTETNLILSNIFKIYPVDFQQLRGKIIEFYVDGQKAGYTTPIKEGSEIEIKFI